MLSKEAAAQRLASSSIHSDGSNDCLMNRSEYSHDGKARPYRLNLAKATVKPNSLAAASASVAESVLSNFTKQFFTLYFRRTKPGKPSKNSCRSSSYTPTALHARVSTGFSSPC